jgi:MOSC domain-containing protein YiiM
VEQAMKIVSIAVSRRKGTRKQTVLQAKLGAGHGIQGDAHAGPWHRQVSFLASESIAAARDGGLKVDFGDFAENIATLGVDWSKVQVGTRLRLGESVEVEITQIGKECHRKCAIFYQAGDCIMPREGIFGRVLRDGTIRRGDPIRILFRPAAEPGG